MSRTYGSSPLPGHALWSEGRAYVERDGKFWRKSAFDSPQREGFAVCQCRATSPVLTSNGQRKAWHREHKQQIRNQKEQGR